MAITMRVTIRDKNWNTNGSWFSHFQRFKAKYPNTYLAPPRQNFGPSLEEFCDDSEVNCQSVVLFLHATDVWQDWAKAQDEGRLKCTLVHIGTRGFQSIAKPIGNRRFTSDYGAAEFCAEGGPGERFFQTIISAHPDWNLLNRPEFVELIQALRLLCKSWQVFNSDTRNSLIFPNVTDDFLNALNCDRTDVIWKAGRYATLINELFDAFDTTSGISKQLAVCRFLADTEPETQNSINACGGRNVMDEFHPSIRPHCSSLLPILKSALNFLFGDVPDSKDFGVVVYNGNASHFYRQWLELTDLGSDEIKVLEPTSMGAARLFDHHPFLAPLLGDCATTAMQIVSQELHRPPFGTTRSILVYLESIVLYEMIKTFSHGQEADVVNSFLAPARLLILEGDVDAVLDSKGAWRCVWSPFFDQLLGSDTARGMLSEEMRHACEPVRHWFNEGNGSMIDFRVLERVMQLLTRIRSLASGRLEQLDFHGCNGGPVDPLECSENEGPHYRVLVVDDHSRQWRPIFKLLQTRLKRIGMSVLFEFSLDGMFVVRRSAEKPSSVSYVSYDLVILDVLLGEYDGRDILRRLRERFPHLPVLLWTTSQSEEISTQISLANGLLLKKSIRMDDFFHSIHDWILRGRATRTSSLPNSMFNHLIRSPSHRLLATQFHEWCLKQLDGFHAIDSGYFRVFTDHGGRHIVKLWELCEQVLQLFLDDDDELLLPIDPSKREREIVCIYLTVICHELGMFPMRIGHAEVESFSEFSPRHMKAVRGLHAARGMLLIEDPKGAHWYDPAGRSLREAMDPHMCNWIATLIGYHARLFKSLEDNDFLHWVNQEKRVVERLCKVSDEQFALVTRSDWYKASMMRLCDWASHLEVHTDRHRLRRQCALFRFVDALDITASRNPADYLCAGQSRSATGLRELLKRQIAENVRFSDGLVEVLLSIPSPSRSTLEMVIPILVGIENPKSGNSTDWEDVLADPWKADCSVNALKTFQSGLDKWLTLEWERITKATGLNEERLRVVATISALSVAGELIDEYDGIQQVGLEEFIYLKNRDLNSGGFRWNENGNYDSLTVIREFLDKGPE